MSAGTLQLFLLAGVIGIATAIVGALLPVPRGVLVALYLLVAIIAVYAIFRVPGGAG